MRLIFHADDLGISLGVNNAIFRLMDAGKLTSASILANGPAVQHAISRSRCYPQCSFGVHLNTTQFAPLVGRAVSSPIYIHHEWSAQIDRLLQAGISVTHIDSHHHTHTHFSLYGTLTIVCRQYGIRHVRLRHTFTEHPLLNRFRFDNQLFNWKLRQRFACTDHFGAFAAFSRHSFAPESTIEIMLHPGNPRYELESLAFERSLNSDFLLRHQCINYRDLN